MSTLYQNCMFLWPSGVGTTVIKVAWEYSNVQPWYLWKELLKIYHKCEDLCLRWCRKSHDSLLPVRIKLMYIPWDVLPSCLDEHPQMKDFLITRPMIRLWWLNVGNNAIYSLIAVLHISSMSRKSKPMLTLCRQTRTEQWPGARLSSIAYKYNLLIVLKILSYTLYRKQLEEIGRRAFSKTEQDWWSVPGLAKMDRHYPEQINSKSHLNKKNRTEESNNKL